MRSQYTSISLLAKNIRSSPCYLQSLSFAVMAKKYSSRWNSGQEAIEKAGVCAKSFPDTRGAACLGSHGIDMCVHCLLILPCGFLPSCFCLQYHVPRGLSPTTFLLVYIFDILQESSPTFLFWKIPSLRKLVLPTLLRSHLSSLFTLFFVCLFVCCCYLLTLLLTFSRVYMSLSN